MNKPAYLRPGDRIRIVSPAGKVHREKILGGMDLLRQAGFELIPGKSVFCSHDRFAGTDEQRLADLQEALDDPLCRAVICSRGGYGAIRIAPRIKFNRFRRHPKWLTGFSDITVLHACLQQTGFCSIHGAMPVNYLKDGKPAVSFVELIRLLEGSANPAPEFPPCPQNREGVATGMLTGGNLSILCSLLGTPLESSTDGCILFIEEVSEQLYKLDRMMHSLRLAGKLKKLKALVAGQFTEMKEGDSPFGQSVEEIIRHAVRNYDYPVCFGFPAGHSKLNLPLMLGASYSLSVKPDRSVFRLIS
ncbi:MAG: LD-carboxypeptidase [Mangrovibacterium sp.]